MEIKKVKYLNQEKDLEIAQVKFEDIEELKKFTDTIVCLVVETNSMYFKTGSQPNDVIVVKQGNYITVDKYGRLQEFTSEEYKKELGILECIHQFSKSISQEYPRRCIRCKEIETI